MNKYITSLSFILILAICDQPISAQTIDSIADLQNSRSLSDGRLYRLLRASDPMERSRAAIALANIQDSASIQFLLPMLKDSIPSVRRSAAFALGQIGRAGAGSPLLDCIKSDSDPGCVREFIDAAAKCGTRENLRALVEMMPTISRKFESSIALSVARFAIRRIKDSVATEYVAGLIGNAESTDMAVYAMMRIGDSMSVKRHLPALLSAMNDRSPYARMWTATLFGLVADSASAAVVRSHALGDPDWRVRVNCIRSLRLQRSEDASPVLISLIADTNEHAALTALSILNADPEKYSTEGVDKKFESLLTDSVHSSWRRRGEASLFLARVSKGNSIPQLIQSLNDNSLFRSRIISSLGETKSASAIPFLQAELLRSDSRTVSAAIEAYQNIVSGMDSAAQSEFCARVLPLLQRHDISVSFSIASAMEDTSIRTSSRLRNAPQLIAAYQKLSTPVDIEVMVEFINVFAGLKLEAAIPALQKSLHDHDRIIGHAAADALHAITGKDYTDDIRSSPDTAKYYKPEDVKLLKQYHSASLVTSRGIIRIEFRPDAAPFTVLNFMILVRRHFYDGLLFHRVVSNFVIQGGDPLGTGFGGPGYAISTEVHPDALYSEGAVGMASAGKDTEGSQFFVTHCTTPHLDGRYSIFGYTKDMDVVDRIQIGDTILSATLVK